MLVFKTIENNKRICSGCDKFSYENNKQPKKNQPNLNYTANPRVFRFKIKVNIFDALILWQLILDKLLLFVQMLQNPDIFIDIVFFWKKAFGKVKPASPSCLLLLFLLKHFLLCFVFNLINKADSLKVKHLKFNTLFYTFIVNLYRQNSFKKKIKKQWQQERCCCKQTNYRKTQFWV